MGKAIELGSCLYTLIGAAVVAWGIWRAWVRPRDRQVVNLADRRERASWSLRGEIARLFLVEDAPPDMSSTGTESTSREAGDSGDCHLSPTPSPVIAMPSNAVNDEVTVNAVDADAVNQQVNIIPAEAREFIRFQAKAEALADLLSDGQLSNQARAIETVYHCSRTSSKRPDTPYQRARVLVEQLVNRRPLFYDDLRAKVQAEVEQLHFGER